MDEQERRLWEGALGERQTKSAAGSPLSDPPWVPMVMPSAMSKSAVPWWLATMAMMVAFPEPRARTIPFARTAATVGALDLQLTF